MLLSTTTQSGAGRGPFRVTRFLGRGDVIDFPVTRLFDLHTRDQYSATSAAGTLYGGPAGALVVLTSRKLRDQGADGRVGAHGQDEGKADGC